MLIRAAGAVAWRPGPDGDQRSCSCTALSTTTGRCPRARWSRASRCRSPRAARCCEEGGARHRARPPPCPGALQGERQSQAGRLLGGAGDVGVDDERRPEPRGGPGQPGFPSRRRSGASRTSRTSAVLNDFAGCPPDTVPAHPAAARQGTASARRELHRRRPPAGRGRRARTPPPWPPLLVLLRPRRRGRHLARRPLPGHGPALRGPVRLAGAGRTGTPHRVIRSGPVAARSSASSRR